jgi:hypothetical protein
MENQIIETCFVFVEMHTLVARIMARSKSERGIYRDERRQIAEALGQVLQKNNRALERLKRRSSMLELQKLKKGFLLQMTRLKKFELALERLGKARMKKRAGASEIKKILKANKL